MEWQPVSSHKYAFYPDYLDPYLIKKFIEFTHKWYFKKFGKTIKVFFLIILVEILVNKDVLYHGQIIFQKDSKKIQELILKKFYHASLTKI